MKKTINKFDEKIIFDIKTNDELWFCYQNHWSKSCCNFNYIQIENMIAVCLNKPQLDCLMKMLCNVC